MSDLALSKAVRQATVFLEQVHADVRALLATLEGMMVRAEWRSAFGKRVSWDLAGKFEGGCWVLPEASLLFLPQVCAGTISDRLIAVSCTFTQPEGTEHDYATFAASAVHFPIAVSAEDVWSEWEASPNAYKACLGKGGVVTLSVAQFSGWFRRAANVATVILPLSDLTDADTLRTKVVEPLLVAEKKLGAKK